MSDRTSSYQGNEDRRRAATSDEAAAWVARRDRGLSAAEQAEFDRWERDPANARLLAEFEGPFAALDRAARLRPADGSPPDANLLTSAKIRSSRRTFWAAGGLAAAAAIAVLLLPVTESRRTETTAGVRGVVVRHAPERLSLPDGSTVELKHGTRVETDFTRQERRVRLAAGDAHFTVAKDASRPFIVTIGNVTVRAVGTAFTISASTAAVEVVVTEGRVRVDDVDGRNLIAPDTTVKNEAPESLAAEHPPALDAGQRVVIPVGPGPLAPVPITAATPEIIDRNAGWRSVWLEFGDMPLAQVVHEFNQHAAEHQQPMLCTADATTGRVLVSGTFRTDGVDAFVRLLHSSFGINATAQADGSLALRKTE
jgi:transmembrane sensor